MGLDLCSYSLKIRRTLPLHGRASLRIHQRKRAGVQKQARGHGLYFWWRVQSIAQYGMPQGLQVQAQLVAAAGQRFKFHPAALVLRILRYATPAGLAGFAIGLDNAQGAAGPIDGDWQVDSPPDSVRVQEACHLRYIALAHHTVGEGVVDSALGVGTARHQQEARGRHVQAVYH